MTIPYIASNLGLRTFGPYAPAVSPEGRVAFYGEGEVRAILVDGVLALEHRGLNSHPVFWKDGVAAYCSEGLVSSEGMLYEGPIGPLGPTTNGRAIAFRVDEEAWVWDEGAHRIGHFPGFMGLPLIDSQGRVSVRCHAGIIRDGEVIANLPELSRFPALDGDTVIFAGVDEAGRKGLFSEDGLIWWDEEDVFESVRGALPGLVFATPRSGALGIYREYERVFGDPDVVDFALNPVSMNADGVWAVRAKYADGREAICRFE